MKKTKKDAFTLVELIIVIAIIAILTAVLAPQYIKYVAKSKETVCLSCRADILHEIQIERAAGSEETAQTLFDQIMAREKDRQLCPDGGAYTLKTLDDGETIACNHHDQMPAQIGDEKTMGSITSSMSKPSTSRLDSGAALVSSSSESAKVLEELKSAGIDLNALGASSWAYINHRLLWSSTDISSLKDGDEVPTIQYNTVTGNYSVWIAKVSHGTTGSSDQSYAIMDPSSGYKPSTEQDKGNQTYEQALMRYQELVKKMEAGN